MNIQDIANKFVVAIDRHDVETIYELMTDDHRFIDSMGNITNGREEMKKGWNGYFKMVPDYLIEITGTFVSGNTVVLLGKASGTYSADGTLKPENHWETPAAWRALIEGEYIKEWQVFADNEPIREVMRKA